MISNDTPYTPTLKTIKQSKLNCKKNQTSRRFFLLQDTPIKQSYWKSPVRKQRLGGFFDVHTTLIMSWLIMRCRRGSRKFFQGGPTLSNTFFFFFFFFFFFSNIYSFITLTIWMGVKPPQRPPVLVLTWGARGSLD